MCKANYAHRVKRKMSSETTVILCFLKFLCINNRVIMLTKSDIACRKCLTVKSVMYIIIFTEDDRLTANQTILSARAGHTESPPESGTARELPWQRVLRPGRFVAGEVRDAAACGCRQATHKPGSPGVWLFAPLVLSGTGSLSRSWTRRAAAAETRAPVRAQAHSRADAVCGTTSTRRADDLQGSGRRTNRTTLRRVGSPAQYRSPAAASKKTSVSPPLAAVLLADRRLVAAYEQLRSQAVQGSWPGAGLALIMTRGFRCWMEVCSQLFANEGNCTQVPDQPTPSIPSGLRGELVILLASMLLRRASQGVA